MRLGQIFAIFFAYKAIVYGNLFLVIIAIFIYTSASNEGFQAAVMDAMKNMEKHDEKTRDIDSTKYTIG